MRRWTTIFGVAFLALGLGFFVGTGMKQHTALIPAIFGVVFLICAWISTTPERRKHAMHVAALLSLVGLGATVTAIPKLLKHAQGEAIERATAVQARGIMAILCLAFFGLAMNSFMTARRKRKAGEAP